MTEIHNYELFRQLSGLLFLTELVTIWPFFFRYFGTPYNPGSFIRNRGTAVVTAIVTALAAASLASGIGAFLGALVLLVFFRFVHVDSRYASLSRGAGAVGLVPYIVSFYFVMLEASRHVDSTGFTYGVVSTVFRIDIGVMLMCAGATKFLSGYRENEGVEYALANPFWSHFHWIFRRVRPTSWIFRFQNVSTFGLQVASGILLLIPATQTAGAVLLLMVYVYVVATINVALLGPLMLVIGVALLPELGLSLWPASRIADGYGLIGDVRLAALALQVAAIGYITVMVVLKAYLYVEKYFGWTLPRPLLRPVKAVCGFVPVFMWRVFTRDVSYDFVRLAEVTPDGESHVIVDEHVMGVRSLAHLWHDYRFLHPTEVVTLTTIAHQLNYDDGLAKAQAMASRYVRTLGPELRTSDGTIHFDIIRILKRPEGFEYQAVRRFELRRDGTVVRSLDPRESAQTP